MLKLTIFCAIVSISIMAMCVVERPQATRIVSTGQPASVPPAKRNKKLKGWQRR